MDILIKNTSLLYIHTYISIQFFFAPKIAHANEEYHRGVATAAQLCLYVFRTWLYPIGDVNGYSTPHRASTKAALTVDIIRSFHFFFALIFFCDILPFNSTFYAHIYTIYIVIGLPLLGNFQPAKNGRGLIHIHKVNSIMSERKAVIKNADMGEEMQQDAVDCATQALEKFNIEKVMC